jgi:predicted Zn-dependent peptidase
LQRTQLDDGLVRTDGPNGLVVLTERLPSVRSVALGTWVRTASAHEPRRQMGISHCLEHMVFKGTARYSARDLALSLETRGGSLDAYTGRDNTSYQAHVLDEDLPLAVDVLTELVRRPLLRPEDLELERNVILEEIAGVADTPDDLVFELHAETLWGRHPYGFSILGTEETVGALSAADLAALHRARYNPGNMVIAAAGRVDHDALCALLAKDGWFDAPAGDPAPTVQPAVAVRGAERREARDTHQMHVVLGTDGLAAGDPRRFALSIVINALGGGMSSRLFQRVREELGLCYAVYAYKQLMAATGVIGIYVGTGAATAEAAVDAIREECARLAADGLPADELAAGRRQLKGQVMLALESTGARMSRLASLALHGDPYRRLDDVLALIDAVSAEDVRALAAEYLDPARFTTVRLGPA